MKTKFDGLDGLRGIAALVVLAHHALHRAGIELFARGYLAVDLFFMLSGFVIALAYEQRFRSGLGLAAFTKIRVIRLYPLLALGVILGAIEVAAGVYAIPDLPLVTLMQLAFLPAFWLTGSLFPLNGVQWSLFLELIANLLHAACFRWLGNRALAGLILFSAVGLLWTAHLYGSLWVGWSRGNFLGGFARVVAAYFIGVALFRLHRAGRLPVLPVHWAVPALALPLAIVLAHFLGHDRFVDPILVLAVFPVLLVMASRVALSGRSLAAAQWLGAVSYPVYALQIAVAMPAKLLPAANEPRLQLPLWLAVSLLTVLLSWVALRRYDEPLRAWLLSRAGLKAKPIALETAP